jgi:hypothetical protein
MIDPGKVLIGGSVKGKITEAEELTKEKSTT